MTFACGFCHLVGIGSDKQLLEHLDSCPQYLKKYPYENYKKFTRLKKKGVIT